MLLMSVRVSGLVSRKAMQSCGNAEEKLVVEQSRHGYRSSATLAYTVVKRFATAYPVPVGVDLATVG